MLIITVQNNKKYHAQFLLLITVKKQQHTTDAIHGIVSIKLHAANSPNYQIY